MDTVGKRRTFDVILMVLVGVAVIALLWLGAGSLWATMGDRDETVSGTSEPEEVYVSPGVDEPLPTQSR